MVQLACPDASRWQALLADSADADEAAELESHLSGCSRCRGVLDELAVGSSGWLRDAGRLAATTDVAAGTDDPDLTRTLYRLRDGGPDGESAVPLDFLAPSDQPGILGTLGRYQVLGVLGRGACGIVLKALDPDLLRPVAIKVMAPHLAHNGTARQRFLREARAAAAVSHDHVVTIHAVEPADGLPYLVMEYVTGVSLQGRLDRDGPLAPKDIARIGLQTANGLAAAHAMGLIHRDIKPANILLENSVERVKITDFGLARAADDASLTASGTAAGTPLYMSPEQARGETVDHRSDLFSLGSVLYTLATGFPPFRAGTTMGVLNRISNDPPRPIRETIPDFPAALEKIIMQLLEKDPSKRFQVAADVAVRLTAFLNDPQPVAHREPDRHEASADDEKPHGWLAAILPILAGIFVVGAVLIFRTPKGTLIVEVDDPEVKVKLDGDNGDELMITGAGTQEVRLKLGTYRVSADKDGKTATVSQEVVTITKNGKQVVKVKVEPPPSPPPAAVKSTTLELPVLLEQRMKNLLPKAQTERLQLMRFAWRLAAVKEFGFVPSDKPTPETHPSFPRLQSLMLESAKEDTAPDRLTKALTDAYALAGTILADTPMTEPKGRSTVPPDKRNEEPDELQRRLMKEFQSLTDRLAKSATGRVLLTASPGADPDKATAGLSQDDAFTAKRLLALRDQFGLLVPKAQQELSKWEKAKLALSTAKERYNAGTISSNELEAARLDVTASERALQTANAAMTGIVADLHKIADELTAARDTPEAAFRKVMSDYDALALRLAKTSVGRLLATIPTNRKWTEGDVENAVGPDEVKVDRGQKLLTYRDQIMAQASKAETAINERANRMQSRATKKKEDLIPNIDEEIAKNEQDIRFRTAAIHSLLDDLKKLADEIDPPAKK